MKISYPLVIILLLLCFIGPASAAVAEFSYYGGTATSSSTVSGYVAANCFDNNAVTFWSTANPATNSQWIMFDFNATTTHKVSKYILQARAASAATDAPRCWTFQGSNDNFATVVDLDRRTAQSFTNGETKTFDSFTQSVNVSLFRYYRAYITFGGSDVYTSQLAEVELWGEDSVTPIALSSLSRGTVQVGGYTWFNDTSLNTPAVWCWTFGDGGFSDVANGSHSYTRIGIYNVSSNVSNSGGFNRSYNIIRVIRSTASPEPCIPAIIFVVMVIFWFKIRRRP